MAVVSASFARQFWPDRDPIGQTFFMAFELRTVVGVVGDVRVRGLEQQSEPQTYMPATQMGDNVLIDYAPKDLVVRASVPVATLTGAIRDVDRDLSPDDHRRKFPRFEPGNFERNLQLLDRIEAEGMRLVQCHFPTPGWGTIVRLEGRRYFQAL